MSRALLLQHDVVDAALRQMPADRQTGLAAADDGDRMTCWRCLSHDVLLIPRRRYSSKVSFLECVDGHARIGTIREGFGGRLDALELGHRARTGESVFRPHPVAGDGERGATARQEVIERIALTGAK